MKWVLQRFLLFISFSFWWEKDQLSITKMDCKGYFRQLSWAAPNDYKSDRHEFQSIGFFFNPHLKICIIIIVVVVVLVTEEERERDREGNIEQFSSSVLRPEDEPTN